MITTIFIGYILNYLGLLNGWILFWYIVSIVLKVIGICIKSMN